MAIIKAVIKNSQRRREAKQNKNKQELIRYLKQLINLESKLWGVTIAELSSGEETILEDLNHLIYLISREKHNKLHQTLKSKDVSEFFMDLKELKQDFNNLKKQIKERDKLKGLISNYTIKLVEKSNYVKLENIFILEKQLYDVLDKQDEEFNNIFKDLIEIEIDENNKMDVFIHSLKKIRVNLAGHMDFHELWQEEKQGYSNTSNILHALVKEVQEDV